MKPEYAGAYGTLMTVAGDGAVLWINNCTFISIVTCTGLFYIHDGADVSISNSVLKSALGVSTVGLIWSI